MPEVPRPRVCVFAPSPVLTVTIERSPEGDAELHIHPGAQGYWVARMVNLLGCEVRFCAPLGGETGRILEGLFADQGIHVVKVDASAPNAGYVHDRRDGERKVIVETPAARLGRHESDDLYTVTVAEALAAGTAILTGPLHPGILADDTFARLAHDLGENGVAVVADLSGEQLRGITGLEVLKVSHEELLRDEYVASESIDELLAVARSFEAEGVARHLVISRADAPALAVIEGEAFEVVPPKFQPVDHRGAGDSMTAAIAAGLARGMAIAECLRLGAAAGALNVTRHGLGSGRRESIEQLAGEVAIRPLQSRESEQDRGHLEEPPRVA